MKNCFTYSSWRFYLRKPWEFFEDTWLNLKAAWQRATRGWANRDTWNLDGYLLEILPEMIDYLAEHAHGYPGEHAGFPTFESWQEFLRNEIVTPLRNAREDQNVQKNEYEEEYMSYPFILKKTEDEFYAINDNTPDPLVKKYFEREKEIDAWRSAELSRAMTTLARSEIYWHLWD